MHDGTPQDYGDYTLSSATLISLPAWSTRGGGEMTSTGPSGETPRQAERRKRLTTRFKPYGKPYEAKAASRTLGAAVKAPTLLANVQSVGVMDVGQGGCNMLIQGDEPLMYFDIGYPLWFFVGSLPANVRSGDQAYAGPVRHNHSGPMQVLLSHWDWDHWRLGFVASMANSIWVVPQQNVGPATMNFINTLVNLNQFPNGAPWIDAGSVMILRCNPGANWFPAFIMNNSGLAAMNFVRLPVTDPNPHRMVMTGDANFTSLPLGVLSDLVAINAVHHGSIAHNASVNLPAPSAGHAAGRLGYSYGIRVNAQGALWHCYGFPVPGAVANYAGAAWTVPQSTAEAANINNQMPTLANRGNVRIGDQTALNAAYNGTAFAAFPNPIT